MLKLFDQFQPCVIDDALIRRSVVLKSPADHSGAAAPSSAASAVGGKGKKKAQQPPQPQSQQQQQQQQTVPFDKITHLRMSYAGVAKIDNLIGLSSLTILQLDNNALTRIENLGQLGATLEVLDLSFNRITKIEGLDQLKKLRELSLAANEVAEIGDGLDALTCLELLTLGRNKIADIAQVVRLRKLPRLTSLSLAGNPLATGADYPQFVLAHLGTRLRYLDFRLIEDTTRASARAAYAEQIKALEAADAEAEAQREVERKRQERLALLKEANLLQVETLFDDLLRSDADLQALSILPSLHDAKEEYATAVTVLAADFKKAALEQHQVRLAERALFRAACQSAIEAVDTTCAEEVAAFDKRVRESASDPAAAPVETAAKLKERSAALAEELLEAEIALSEQINTFTKLFDKKMSDIDALIVAAMQTFFGRVRDAEAQFHERVTATVLSDYEALRANPSSDTGEAIRQLLKDKDTLLNMVGASRDTQTVQIDGLLEELRKAELQTRDAIVADAKAEEAQRDRARCAEVWQLQRNNDALIDRLCCAARPKRR